jgi:acyl dehydratase
MVTTVHALGELVWESTSTYLRRGKGDPSASTGTSFPDAPPTGTVWRLPGDLGRKYAAVSGDHNPIHLYPLTAKALGFPRQIAHGMWSKARCVAALENRLPDGVRVDVAFKKPILLPGSVAFGSTPVEGGFAFSLSSPRSGAPHLAGRTTAL